MLVCAAVNQELGLGQRHKNKDSNAGARWVLTSVRSSQIFGARCHSQTGFGIMVWWALLPLGSGLTSPKWEYIVSETPTKLLVRKHKFDQISEELYFYCAKSPWGETPSIGSLG